MSTHTQHALHPACMDLCMYVCMDPHTLRYCDQSTGTNSCTQKCSTITTQHECNYFMNQCEWNLTTSSCQKTCFAQVSMHAHHGTIIIKIIIIRAIVSDRFGMQEDLLCLGIYVQYMCMYAVHARAHVCACVCARTRACVHAHARTQR